MVNLGAIFPNFKADTTVGPIDFYEWLGDSWGILFSHPADFTPVCTTELARIMQLESEFRKRRVKVIALSCDTIENHNQWMEDIKMYANCSSGNFPYPIISDQQRDLAVLLQMIDPAVQDANGLPLTAGAVFVIDPIKRMRLSILYPATTGRNFDEILRGIDSLQLTDKFKVVTPEDWKPGQPVMVHPSVTERQLQHMFPRVTILALRSGKSYMRYVPYPH